MAVIVVYLFLVSYGRSKPDQIHIVIPSFLQVSPLYYLELHIAFISHRTAVIAIHLSEPWLYVLCLTSPFLL